MAFQFGNSSNVTDLEVHGKLNCITGTGTAAVTTSPYCYSKWVATTDYLGTTPTNGMLIFYKIPVAGNGTYGTCLALNDGTTTGAFHPVVGNSLNTAISTKYSVNQIVLLVYNDSTSGTVYANSSSSSSISGVWTVVNDYDSGNTNTVPSGYCTTGASTAAKTATCNYYTATAKSYLHIVVRYANTSKGAITLNVNSQGAKPIYINGTASSTSNYTLPAGTYITYYDGTNYYFNTNGILPGIPNIAYDSTTSALVIG